MKKNNYLFYGIFGMAILLLLLNFSYKYEGFKLQGKTSEYTPPPKLKIVWKMDSSKNPVIK